MANTFDIPLINPLRLVKQVIDNDAYNLLPFDLRIDDKCYLQKFSKKDTTKIQFLSDFAGVQFTIHRAEDRVQVLSIVPEEKVTSIIGQTFKCYEITIDFTVSELPPDKYYCMLSYVNQDAQTVIYYSEPILLAVEQPGTILFEYTNSDNNYSIIFETGIEFKFRVEGTIKQFTPELDTLVYEDQKKNPTLLDAVPSRKETLFIGNAEGLPDWVIDKINRAMACDQKKIEGVFYEKKEGSDWEQNRPDEYEYSGLKLDIKPKDNNFMRLYPGDDPSLTGFVPMQKIKNYFNNGANLTVSNIFRKYTLLEKICIINLGADFTINIGTTDGGSQIGSFTISDILTTLNLNELFNGAATVYLTGLTGTNEDISIIYKQLDESPIPAGSTPNPYSSIGKGGTVIYTEIEPGAFAIDFNVTSGLGNSGTAWEGWAIDDGRNGTYDQGGRFIVGWKNGDPVYGSTDKNDEVGANEVTLTQDELPSFNIPFNYDGVGRDSGPQETMRNYPGANRSANIAFPGGDQAHENRPLSRIRILVTKIQD